MAKSSKRPLSTTQPSSSKKRKLGSNTKPSFLEKKYKGKERAADRDTIPIPNADDDEDFDVSDQDLEVFQQYGQAVHFLSYLDREGISRSKKETDRLHQLNKPVREAPIDDDLPSVHSHDEDDGVWDSDEEEEQIEFFDNEKGDIDSDAEMSYEAVPRKLPKTSQKEQRGILRLPIKLPDGQIQDTGRISTSPSTHSDSTESRLDQGSKNAQPSRRDDVATGARFGRPAVIDVVTNESRKMKIQAAKEQIASICQEVVADPENSLGLLRRLHTFSLPSISSPTHPEPVANDTLIRKLAILSQLAVFKDIIPGYRIRGLTDKEKGEKVSQAVARTREWEQGLVSVYQSYLRSLEQELKAHSELSEVSLQCICTLLTELTHFNFRVNLMSCVVAQLSRNSWTAASEHCLNALNTVFREDLSGVASLEVVRLLNRMIKEKRFKINPIVLSCLFNLRLKNELGVRSSETRTDKGTTTSAKMKSKGKEAARRAKGKPTEQPHLSKKAKKVLKETKEIEREFRDAEAEVDKEERAVTHTETLKHLFVLYFGILKNPKPTPLLTAALEGIAKYAHLVNIDFFKDLMKVLKGHIERDDDEYEDGNVIPDEQKTKCRLLCIVTAFELLSGQGESLNIDLNDFITHLYAIILPLALMPNIDMLPTSSSKPNHDPRNPRGIAPNPNVPSRSPSPSSSVSTGDMLFKALSIAFGPRTLGKSMVSSSRTSAFVKRLLIASVHWPASLALRSLSFAQGLIARDPKLEALLTTEERTFDGVYRPEVDDPQLCNAFGTCLWELKMLETNHLDPRVRAEARNLMEFDGGAR
ncbi:nucleolar complex-associated protein 3 [Dendrothele bispora CBS 962.96]|uniref:Nucleolar complex-associated protein 3 n=1 Tax=Dendrothele bispora (strain CBS 962.96) TaxID=1314807 RepID=A0A4S8LN10_DENBC|nr:nucleolar complex-associated protein 3 [Dendrothele bispora CBS 962.96]